MKTFRFRDFIVYKKARRLRSFAEVFLNRFPSKERYRLIDQIDRALLSVILNIAEGSGRRSDIDFARFLQISISSVHEVIAGFDSAHDRKYITDEELSQIESECESLARAIGSFMKKLRSQSANLPIC